MMWKWIVMVVLLVLQGCIPPTLGYGEPDSSGHPNYQERANHVFLNAVRIAPSQYKTVYMAGYSPSPSAILGSTYPAQPPLYLEPRLVSSASYHSSDMAIHNCFSHPSCNGTDTFVRIESYYTCSGTMGENIAAGYSDPLDTSINSNNNQWLCDSTNNACAADGSGNDGHRSNMMSSGYRAVGTGYAYNASATYRYYWTQDFGGAVCSPVPTSPVYGASHHITSGTTKFIAVYYTSPAVAPSTASVVIAGVSNALSLDIGASGAGTYAFSQTAGTACRSYYFTFGTVRYPETGCLVTYGEGTCTTSFDATCGGTTSAAVAATTVASSTTKVSSITTTTTTSHATVAATTSHATVGTAAATSGASATTGGTPLPFKTHGCCNTTVSITNSFVYSSRTGLAAGYATTSGNNFIMFNHVPAVTNVWTTLQFYVAASSSSTFLVYFNGGYYQSKAVTTAWTFYSIPLTSLANPSTGAPYAALGSPNQLVFQNGGSTAYTLYLSGVALS